MAASLLNRSAKNQAPSSAFRSRKLFGVLLATLLISSATVAQQSFHFEFGPGKVPGYKRVRSDTFYSKEAGYGFEPGSSISCLERRGGGSPAGFCTSEKPFYFSVALPEGNYIVRITFGDFDKETRATVKAELRRLMIEQVVSPPGKFVTRTFAVNIRTPAITGGGEVKLKDREKTTEAWAWDEKLTLEFNNSHPAISAIEISRADKLPTLYLLGDSTVCDQPSEPYNSWGQMLTRFFTPIVVVANNAESGESLRSSLNARRLDKVVSTMKPGDYLLIQYGHNDEKEKGEGKGPFTSYKADLKQFVAAAREHGATPILITPVQRRTFDEQGRITNSHGDYPEAMRQVAREEKVALIDLNAMSARFYEALGPEKSKLAFKEGDGTHHNNYGSYELAKCVVEGIRAAKLGLARFLVTDVPAFDPGRPDPLESFSLPPSPSVTTTKPLGS